MSFPTEQFLSGVAAAAVVAIAARRARALSRSGGVATALLGSVTFGLGGVAWAAPLLAFFVFSSLLSAISKRLARRDFTEVFEKGGERDAGQVLANGGVAGVVVVLNFLHPDPLWYAAFVGSLSAAAADTWGTEIGVISRGSVRSVLTFRLVPPGTSGGVSLVGSVGSVAGACLVAWVGALFVGGSLRFAIGATVAGIAGAFADSALGATVQAGRRCPRCLADTERKEHCGVATELVRGFAWANNDAVNLACCVVGAVAAALIVRGG